MKRLFVLLTALLFSIPSMMSAGAFAAGKAEPLVKGERTLNVATLEKMKKLNADMEKLKKDGKLKDEDDDGESDSDQRKEKKKSKDMDPAEIARALDANPQAKAALARAGMSSMEYATAMVSMFPAAFYLMFEQAMDKKKAAELYATYPKERQANIELLRKNKEFMQ